MVHYPSLATIEVFTKSHIRRITKYVNALSHKNEIIKLFAWYYHTDTNGATRNYENAKRSHSLQQILDRIYAEYGDDLFYRANTKYQIEIN